MQHTKEELDIAQSLLNLNQIDFKAFVSTQTERRTIVDVIKTDKKFNSFTGLQSFKLIDHIENLIEKHFLITRIQKFTLKEQIILTFIKLKLNVSYKILAFIFDNITARYCSQFFYKTLPMLYSVLKPTIYIPKA